MGAGKAGAPYGCNDYGRTYYKDQQHPAESTCSAIIDKSVNHDYSTFGATYNSAGMGLVNNGVNGAKAAVSSLAQIFLNFKLGNVVYNYINGGADSGIPPAQDILINTGNNQVSSMSRCLNQSSRYHNANPLNGWCGILPIVSNVKLYDAEGQLVPSNGNNVFTINEAGFYTLSFTTDLDVEQIPISNLIIDWGTNNGKVVASDLDERPNVSSPFQFIYYYQMDGSNTKTISIKAIDNWGFYGCNLGVFPFDCQNLSSD